MSEDQKTLLNIESAKHRGAGFGPRKNHGSSRSEFCVPVVARRFEQSRNGGYVEVMLDVLETDLGERRYFVFLAPEIARQLRDDLTKALGP